MKLIFCFLALTILTSSCSTYQATVKKHEKLSYEAIRAFPEWKYVEPKGKKMITPVISLTAGAIYGYQTQFSYGGKTYKQAENAAIWGGVGLLTGAIINGIIFPKRWRKTQNFDLTQSEKWVTNYNKTTGNNYLIQKKESNNSLILVPKNKVEELRAQYKILIADLENENPSTGFYSLQSWKNKLKGEFSILPPNEVGLISASIFKNEQKVANKELSSKVNSLIKVKDEYTSIEPLMSFERENNLLYSTANKASQDKADKMIEEKINTILSSTLAEERVALNKIDYHENSVRLINEFYENFNRKYKMVAGFAQVKGIYTLITDKKTSVIAINFDKINDKIKNSATLNQLIEIENLYLSLITQSNDPKIKALSQKVSERKTVIDEENSRRMAQQEKEAKLAEATALQRYGFAFNTEGLNNKELIKNMFLGNFVDIPFNRDNLLFAVMIESYMKEYAKRCASSLPNNKVQIYKDVCATERVTRNGFGVEISRYCIEWREEGTGLYASPNLYDAYKEIKKIVDKDRFSNVWDLIMKMSQGNGMKSMNEMMLEAESMQSDMAKVIQLNGCGNTALKRFEANLIQFANNTPPIKLDGNIDYKKADYSKKQDLAKLTGDLVYENSKTWKFKYIPNSVSNVSIVSNDNQNRPRKIRANYIFENFLGQHQKDEVELTFKDGLPDCIYFLNYSTNCRTPDRSVVSNFVSGQYIIE